jgi:hypothetical protein
MQTNANKKFLMIYTMFVRSICWHNKEASKEVGEEKRKEKEALRLEKKKSRINVNLMKNEQNNKKLSKQERISGPVQVGKIDLTKSCNCPSCKKRSAKSRVCT